MSRNPFLDASEFGQNRSNGNNSGGLTEDIFVGDAACSLLVDMHIPVR